MLQPVGSVGVPATVTTPVFEGPIDLLLHLVSSHQVEIYDIPLASVVDAFVAEVAGWETVDLQTLSEFLVIAAVLIELKSRRLLPGRDDVDPDEELVGWEERDLLAGPASRVPGIRRRRGWVCRHDGTGGAIGTPDRRDSTTTSTSTPPISSRE